MVDNRGISPVSGSYFKSGDSSANKMSEEKYGQGGEYFVQEMEEEENKRKERFKDRSAQLRASLNGLAMANVGSILVKKIKEKEEENKKKKHHNQKNETEEEIEEIIFDE